MDSRPPTCLQLHGLGILIVDDSLAGALLALELMQEGAETQIARSGEELLSILSTCNPEAILCELRLPGLAITEIIPWLKTYQRPPEHPRTVVVVTTNAKGRIEAETAGCDGFFTKPTGTEPIIALICRSQTPQASQTLETGTDRPTC